MNGISGDDEPEFDPIPSDNPFSKLEQQRAALAKARTATTRTATTRTADSPVGVAAHPDQPQRRDEPTRDGYRAEAPEQLTRRKRHERSVGVLDVPPRLKKPGWDYQWMAIRVLNQPVDPSRLRDYREGGWRPVLAKDMPDLVEIDAPADSPIEAEACRLYTRPMQLTREAQAEDLQIAQEQQRDRTMAAAAGKSAIRGEEGISGRGVRSVPVSIEIEGLAG